MISSLLSVGGYVVIASKRYYFGVGGGIKSLYDIIESDHSTDKFLTVQKSSFEDGVSNVRELVLIKRIK